MRIFLENFPCALLLIVVMFSVGGCNKNQFIFQIFSFPQGMPPENHNFVYQVKITVSTKAAGSMYRKSKKDVSIKIYDHTHKYLLEDIFHYDAALITAKVDWISEDKLIIYFIESGSQNVHDNYSANLSRSGDRVISVFSYSKKYNKFILE